VYQLELESGRPEDGTKQLNLKEIMTQKYKVWFVDDLPRNLETFKANHGDDFVIETFSKTSDVLQRIHCKEYPDALLCDIFFYDTVAEAERAEERVIELAAKLRQTAIDIRVHDHTRAAGITLIRHIYEYFNRNTPPFPVYAYTSKGPFLLEQSEWDNISKYGAQILLKGRVTPDIERTEIPHFQLFAFCHVADVFNKDIRHASPPTPSHPPPGPPPGRRDSELRGLVRRRHRDLQKAVVAFSAQSVRRTRTLDDLARTQNFY
jgi:hypothetical protein